MDTSQASPASSYTIRAARKITRGHPELQDVCQKLIKIYKNYSVNLGGFHRYISYWALGIVPITANIRNSCIFNTSMIDVDNKVYGFLTHGIPAGREILTSSKGCYWMCKHKQEVRDNFFWLINESNEIVMKSFYVSTVKAIKEQLKKNWRFIDKFYMYPFTSDVIAVGNSNFCLLAHLTRVIDFGDIDEVLKGFCDIF
jgi:hypothetical protein